MYFYASNRDPPPPHPRLVEDGTLEPLFDITDLMTKFHAAVLSSSGKKSLAIFYLRHKPPRVGPFLGPEAIILNIWKRTIGKRYILNFMYLSHMVLTKKIFQYFFVFLWFKPGRPLRPNHFGPKDLHLNKGDKRQLRNNATYQV